VQGYWGESGNWGVITPIMSSRILYSIRSKDKVCIRLVSFWSLLTHIRWWPSICLRFSFWGKLFRSQRSSWDRTFSCRHNYHFNLDNYKLKSYIYLYIVN
jgi:hypothetical protein